ncbi:Com family DNA-binding transcriptional regulator [Acidovorax delafieldii]|uniref:Com family DNA-binding transcriptional regulator n=1 Tax=Acidovorax delafieldii TaxID=47920 RepID=UPI00286AED43|nr:Com family DNA-binding transcriptional regulator [Acidovorax delafieldii]
MEEIRCGHCGRKLAEAVFEQISIKCPRCGTMNHLRALSPSRERLGAPSPMTNHEDSHSLESNQHPPVPHHRQRHHLPGRQRAATAAARPAG